ncbi:hypothetical protein CPAR01_12317 [Colletotrichum paranaense]|uniref:Zn(2)-C6 fungal-type domain-containing protein n=1 Tax=Colletotrichum paranaense TaxID=1914294 RepID=A0ABQ9S9P8_9PEZI|nr:uncharacterized protein CPAR01_12317 [Colletotrichum paranaense]KAK1530005.1 hypothetical protein CPAR01_12317 [Colletotrichum paranaense]
MVSRKPRPYRPKIRGCYECSKRRISCDRAEPECEKCSRKGLKCSGLGVRHRFSDGAASRGFWRGKTVQQAYEQPRDHERGYHSVQIWRTTRKRHFSPTSGPVGMAQAGPAHVESDGATIVPSGRHENTVHNIILESLDRPATLWSEMEAAATRCFTHQPTSSNLTPWETHLLSYFSAHIAVEMVAADGHHNGWRHLVLPIAHMDPLVLKSVLAVSSFHLSNQRRTAESEGNTHQVTRSRLHNTSVVPMQLYATTIHDLGRRRDLEAHDRSSKICTLVVILVLLVSAMVTGSDDFPILFRLLESALATIGGEDSLGHDELSAFIMRQVYKLRVYSAPLLSEDSGILTLSSRKQVTRAFECMKYCSQQRPEHSETVSRIMNLVQQSHNIYLHRAGTNVMISQSAVISLDNHMKKSVERVQLFIETFQSFPADSPGREVLVWAFFVAASGCMTDEHKDFFRITLRECHQKSHFENILKALNHLERIWDRQLFGLRWASQLPEARLLIM